MNMLSASQGRFFSADTHYLSVDPNSTSPERVNDPDGLCDRLEPTQSNTKFALVESAKAFGRMVYKSPLYLAFLSYEISRVCTEVVTGSAGMIVGGVVGSTTVLTRGCIGARARRFFGLENCKSLGECLTTGFHRGARLGELPGKLLGYCAVFLLGALSPGSSLMLPFLVGFAGSAALVCALATFASIKFCGENQLAGFTENLFQNLFLMEQKTHRWLQGPPNSHEKTINLLEKWRVTLEACDVLRQ